MNDQAMVTGTVAHGISAAARLSVGEARVGTLCEVVQTWAKMRSDSDMQPDRRTLEEQFVIPVADWCDPLPVAGDLAMAGVRVLKSRLGRRKGAHA